ncbi:unnamed protein product [Dibothriocephalus latus]|uniref:Uncharacterized protein n=1 Tax=Dibothriocephalus latus TaxID=60516 RepID=A0A3P7LRY8_DIBLA|nr:unnamed protein product [Dibothriocephalus latus]
MQDNQRRHWIGQTWIADGPDRSNLKAAAVPCSSRTLRFVVFSSENLSFVHEAPFVHSSVCDAFLVALSDREIGHLGNLSGLTPPSGISEITSGI